MGRWWSWRPTHTRSLRIGSRRLLLRSNTRSRSCKSAGIHSSPLAKTRSDRLSDLVSEHSRSLLSRDSGFGLFENPLLLRFRDNGVISCKSRVLSRRSVLRGVARVPVHLIAHSLVRRTVSWRLLHIRRGTVGLSINLRRHRALWHSLTVSVSPKVGL